MNICISPKKFDEICSAIGIDPRELETQKPLTAVLSAEEQAYFDSRASLISKLVGDGYEKAASVICSTACGFYLYIKQLEANAEDNLSRMV